MCILMLYFYGDHMNLEILLQIVYNVSFSIYHSGFGSQLSHICIIVSLCVS